MARRKKSKAKAEFTPHPDGIQELLTGPFVRVDIEHRTARVHQRAREIAPVDTAAYRDSIQQQVAVNELGALEGTVYSDDWRAAILEHAGGPDGLGHLTLTRALDAAGD